MDRIEPTTGEVLRAMMPPEIAKAIIAVKKQVKQLGADDRNEHGKYSFVSVDKFYERIGKLMAEAGLALLIDETSSEVKMSDKSGNPWLFVQFTLTFMHESGALGPPLQRSCALPISGPQAYGAAQSYIEKQFLRQVFKVPTGEKDADDTAGGEPPQSARQAAPARQIDMVTGKSVDPELEAKKAKARSFYNRIRGDIAAASTLDQLDMWMDAAAADLAFIREVAGEEHFNTLQASIRARREKLMPVRAGADEPKF